MTILRRRLVFTILSIAYIAVIFLWADSSMVSRISPYNPYSLLHIPLFGILAVLVTFSLMDIRPLPLNPGLNRFRLFVPGSIALVVAIADEIHQSFIPSRDGSIIDLFLDLVGIALALFIIYIRYQKTEVRKQNPGGTNRK
jgi:VanZ family protein